ncbi:MAG: hypothetical protein WC312_07330 [Candidatus Omnitrophota bacterium]|jgi:hypothetical protein
MKKYRLLIILAILIIGLFYATPVFAIADPDSKPKIVYKWAWRNVMETGDMLIILEESIPYATTPAIICSEAFIFRLLGTDGVTPIGEALTYDYNDYGYGYNVVGFYFSAAAAPAWGQNYYIAISGTPAAFTSPPNYIYQMNASDYSSLTDAEEVENDIESKILLMANDIDIRWALGASYSLLEESELGTVLSIYGEAFFRGALYSVQGYAPDIFRLVISNLPGTALTDRDWDDGYSSNLTSQYPGNDLDAGMSAGNNFLDVDYNLFGLLITLGIACCVTIVGLVVAGDWWGAFAGSIGPLVVCTRMGLFGMGELALITAICWLFLSAKVWKLI